MTHSYTSTDCWTYTDDEFRSNTEYLFFLTWLLYLFNGVSFGSVLWEQFSFYWLQRRNLLWDDQNVRRGGNVKKGENQIPVGVFFSFFSIKTFVIFCCCYSCFSKYYTKREMPRIKLMTACCFKHYGLDTTRILI